MRVSGGLMKFQHPKRIHVLSPHLTKLLSFFSLSGAVSDGSWPRHCMSLGSF